MDEVAEETVIEDTKKRIVIVGATSSIAEHCARLWVKDAAVDLTLVGRNEAKLQHIASDLHVRNPESMIRVLATRFIDPMDIQHLVEGIMTQGAVDLVLIAHGMLPDQQLCQQQLVDNYEALLINGVSPVMCAEAFVREMEKVNHGTVAIIGSVAGDRGRKTNYVYGAAKGLVNRYVQGLQHRLAKTDVKVVLVKPGPTDTPMTAQYKADGVPLACVKGVAQDIVDAIEKKKFIVYTPGKWRLIMKVFCNLPQFVLHKLEV